PIAGAMTRRRELQAALAATARDFQMLAENSTDVILRVDRDQRIIYVSPSCRQFGYEPEQVLGRHADEFAPPEDRDRNGRARAATIRDEPGAGGVYERQLVTASGERVWIEGSPKVLRGPDGEPIGLITQLRDITARRAAQEALAESEARYRLLA